MNRETSIKAYREALASGLISNRRAEILKVIAEHGPITSMEVFKIIDDANPEKLVKVGRYNRGRFSELRDMGVIAEVGVRKDKITGFEVTVYDMTGRLPVKLEKTSKLSRSAKEAVERLVRHMSKWCDERRNASDWTTLGHVMWELRSAADELSDA